MWIWKTRIQNCQLYNFREKLLILLAWFPGHKNEISLPSPDQLIIFLKEDGEKSEKNLIFKVTKLINLAPFGGKRKRMYMFQLVFKELSKILQNNS